MFFVRRVSLDKRQDLGGKQFLVTRPRQNSSALAKRLRNLGAQVIEMPSIHTVAIDPNERLKKALGEIQHSEKRNGLFLQVL